MDQGVSPIFVLLALAAVAIAARVIYQKMRRDALLAKYGDAEVVDKIMRRIVWQGMSKEQLIDSLGRPVAIDEKIYKTKIALTYKYGQTGKNRFSRRVRLENGFVVGWEQK